MINVFQLNYDVRLRSWYDLRNRIADLDIQSKCVEIDKWWQYAPLVNHYLHPQDTDNWPGPWDILSDNTYCEIARGLGMVYTLCLLGVEDIDFCTAINDNNEDVALVLVDNAKYILNYWPNMVVNNNLHDFEIKQKINIKKLIAKIGKA